MTAPEPLVHRAPMRSHDDDVPDGAAVERALALGLCGLGGRLRAVPPTLDVALAALAREHDERLAARVERFAAAPEASFVWTRDSEGIMWLGRLRGEWRYDGSPEAQAVDLVHVRPCEWAPDPIADSRLPPAVRATFGRGGRNWQQTHDRLVSRQSSELWASSR